MLAGEQSVRFRIERRVGKVRTEFVEEEAKRRGSCTGVVGNRQKAESRPSFFLEVWGSISLSGVAKLRTGPVSGWGTNTDCLQWLPPLFQRCSRCILLPPACTSTTTTSSTYSGAMAPPEQCYGDTMDLYLLCVSFLASVRLCRQSPRYQQLRGSN